MRERASRTKGWRYGSDRKAEARYRLVAKRKAEMEKGKCRLTGKDCEEEWQCVYGSSAVREGGGMHFTAKIDACAVAIDRGYANCNKCTDKERCDEVWRCFRKESPAKELREESGRLRRKLDRSGGRVFG